MRFPILFILLFTICKSFCQDSRLDTAKYYDFVEQMPLYANGAKDISANDKDFTKYVRSQVQDVCHMDQDSNKILIHFIVEPDGSVEKTRIVKGVCEEMTQMAVDAVKRAKFLPGKQNGKPVRVKMAVLLRIT